MLALLGVACVVFPRTWKRSTDIPGVGSEGFVTGRAPPKPSPPYYSAFPHAVHHLGEHIMRTPQWEAIH